LQQRLVTSYAFIRKLSQGKWVDAGSKGMMPFNGYADGMDITPTGDLVYAYINPELYVRTKTSDSLAAAPVVTSCTPAYGGTSLVATITGFNFTGATSVKFGQSVALSFTVVSPTTIQAVLGAGTTGPVSVTTSYGTGAFDGFIFSAAPPVITSFSPHSGGINSTVTINGKNFGTANSNNIVRFGAVVAQVVSANDNTLVVKVPAGAAYQPVSVTTRGLTAYTGTQFDVTFKGQNAFTAASFAAKKDFSTIASPTGLSATDIDNDGKTDITITNYNGNQSVYQNLSNVNAISLDSLKNVNGGGYQVANADFDGDGKMDFAYARIPEVDIVKNAGAPGLLSLGGAEYYQTANYPFDVATGELDGDGRPDVVTANNSASLVTILRNSSSTKSYIYFEKEVDYSLDAFSTSVAVADLDGDGKPEIMAVIPNYAKNDGTGFIVIFKNNSTSGKISFAKILELPTGKNPGKPIVADLDNDGKLDIIVPNAGSNTISVYKNQTSASISFSANIDFATGPKPVAICAADLDGDGNVDLAVVNTSNNVSVYKNTGTAGNISFAARVNYPTGNGSDNVVAADLDGDGAPELITSNSTGNSISVLKNNVINAPSNVINFVALTTVTYGNPDITLLRPAPIRQIP
jgi:IPT/TIG domain/FG-GAP-like repeat